MGEPSTTACCFVFPQTLLFYLMWVDRIMKMMEFEKIVTERNPMLKADFFTIDDFWKKLKMKNNFFIFKLISFYRSTCVLHFETIFKMTILCLSVGMRNGIVYFKAKYSSRDFRNSRIIFNLQRLTFSVSSHLPALKNVPSKLGN